MDSLHIERLRTLYSIMAGMPTRAVFMNAWRKDLDAHTPTVVGNKTLIKHAVRNLTQNLTEGPAHYCNTTACALGWAAAYPEFSQAGLKMGRDGHPLFHGYRDYRAGAEFFGLSSEEGANLFYAVGGWVSDPVIKLGESSSQKAIFLRRLRDLLQSKGIITGERSEELRLLEIQRELDEKTNPFVIQLN